MSSLPTLSLSLSLSGQQTVLPHCFRLERTSGETLLQQSSAAPLTPQIEFGAADTLSQQQESPQHHHAHQKASIHTFLKMSSVTLAWQALPRVTTERRHHQSPRHSHYVGRTSSHLFKNTRETLAEQRAANVHQAHVCHRGNLLVRSFPICLARSLCASFCKATGSFRGAFFCGRLSKILNPIHHVKPFSATSSGSTCSFSCPHTHLALTSSLSWFRLTTWPAHGTLGPPRPRKSRGRSNFTEPTFDCGTRSACRSRPSSQLQLSSDATMNCVLRVGLWATRYNQHLMTSTNSSSN